jgi:hypothetical protein
MLSKHRRMNLRLEIARTYGWIVMIVSSAYTVDEIPPSPGMR